MTASITDRLCTITTSAYVSGASSGSNDANHRAPAQETMPISSYPESEWLARRPLIEELYSTRKLTMNQVCRHLCGTGFNVNTRMVKNRLLKWNLHKKLSLVEVRTALELLGPDETSWPSSLPQFRIRCKVISLEEILRSCRRRGIKDPFEWIQSTPFAGLLSPDVEIWSPVTPRDSESETLELNQVLNSESNELPEPELNPARIDTDANVSDESCFPFPTTPVVQRPNEFTLSRLRDPEMYVLGAQAIHQLRSFCLNYLATNDKVAHEEPLVHQFTGHARLQNHMNEGLFHLAKGSINSAFANFRLGFLVLEEILKDVHPMAIALYLMLLCSLTAKKADAIARMLLKQALDLASTQTQVPVSLVNALRAIYHSGELLEMPLLCLRAASDCMANDAATQWKAFYVKERYCDALYHACLTGEGTLRRKELFEAQESFYGRSARNVLITSLNVADDDLIQGRLDEAEIRFSRVLQQSEDLSGFYRAKVCVVALSGLARTAIARARQWCDQQHLRISDSKRCKSPLRGLRDAAGLVKDALQLAEIWFEGSARRTEVLHDLHADVLATSLQLECQLNGGDEM